MDEDIKLVDRPLTLYWILVAVVVVVALAAVAVRGHESETVQGLLTLCWMSLLNMLAILAALGPLPPVLGLSIALCCAAVLGFALGIPIDAVTSKTSVSIPDRCLVAGLGTLGVVCTFAIYWLIGVIQKSHIVGPAKISCRKPGFQFSIRSALGIILVVSSFATVVRTMCLNETWRHDPHAAIQGTLAFPSEAIAATFGFILFFVIPGFIFLWLILGVRRRWIPGVLVGTYFLLGIIGAVLNPGDIPVTMAIVILSVFALLMGIPLTARLRGVRYRHREDSQTAVRWEVGRPHLQMICVATIAFVPLVVCFIQTWAIRESLSKFESTGLGDYLPNVTDKQLKALTAYENIKSLDLSMSSLTNDGLVHLREFKQLKHLKLQGVNLSDTGVGHLSNCHLLESLNLVGCSASDAHFRQLVALENLQQLTLKDANLSTAGLDNILKCSSLQGLALIEATQSGAISTNDLEQLARLPGLEELHIISMEVPNSGLAHLEKLPGLKFLNLSGTTIDSDGLRHVASCSSL